MGLDIYISKQGENGKECLIHWRKFLPVADWFVKNIYGGKVDCNEHKLDWLSLFFLHETSEKILASRDWKNEMQKLFPVSQDFVWTGYRELAYLKMLNSIAEDIDGIGQVVDGEELLIQISY